MSRVANVGVGATNTGAGVLVVRADHTATVADVKQGFAEPAAAEWTGRVHVVDFGAPRKAKAEG